MSLKSLPQPCRSFSDMELPATLGKYELLEFLGGGMSHVYRARDTMIDRTVVVKILTDSSCQDGDAKARFLQEAKLAGSFQHENIVSVFDYGEFDGKPFIVMEYLQGEDLRNAIRDGHLGGMDDRLRTALILPKPLTTFTPAQSCIAMSSLRTFTSLPTAR